ncbi:hypothetical protein [Acinetobacter boissieri]|nr:hypothetical protein [Acinetobacter boissieri]
MLNKKLSGFHLGLGIFYLIMFVMIVVLSFGVNQSLDKVAIGYICFLLFLIALHLKAYYEVRKSTQLGKILSRVLACFLLLGFPIGTLLALLIFSYTKESNWQTSNI